MTAPNPTTAMLTPSITKLLPRAVDLAIERGELPLIKDLTNELKIGRPKANLVRDALARVNWETVRLMIDGDSTTAEHAHRLALMEISGVAETGPGPHLHVVPDAVADTPQVPAMRPEEPAEPAAVTPAVSNPIPDAPVTEASPSASTLPDAATPVDMVSEQVAAEIVETLGEVPGKPVARPGQTLRRPVVWPVLILCLPAFVAIWAGWVEMGRRTGFGKVTLLPGIIDRFQLDTAITLPIGVETYAAYALYVWLSGRVTAGTRTFAKRSAIASLIVGGLGQITYHLMVVAGWNTAPGWVTAIVACIPVAVLGMGATLAHMMHADHTSAS